MATLVPERRLADLLDVVVSFHDGVRPPELFQVGDIPPYQRDAEGPPSLDGGVYSKGRVRAALFNDRWWCERVVRASSLSSVASMRGVTGAAYLLTVARRRRWGCQSAAARCS